MVISLDDTRRDLAEILDAVEILKSAKPTSPAVRDALFERVFAASSGAGAGEQRFAGAGSASHAKPQDWLSSIEGASLDTQSAYLLAAVAVERGEVPAPEGVHSPGDLLNSAVTGARDKLLEDRPSLDHARFSPKENVTSPSTDVVSALAFFRSSADKAIIQILDSSEKTIGGLTAQISHHAADLVDALRALPQLASLGEGASAFVALACDKFRSALDYLKKLLGTAGNDEIDRLIKEFKPHLTIRDVLGTVYRVDDLRKETAALQLRSDVTVEEVDEARTQVTRLIKQFERFITTLKAIRSTLIIVAGIIVAHLAVPLVALVGPVLDALTAAVALVAGLNCLGQSRVLKEIRGIRLIEDSLKPLVQS